MMITASALLIDHYGRVLLAEDPATGMLAPPTAALEAGVLPADTLARTIRESTGLIALPLRLTGLYAGPAGLTLAFRAIQRGGAIKQADGRPVAGFFEASPPPEPMLPAHRQQLADALHHAGGPPVCAEAATSLLGRLQRALGSAPAPPAGAVWNMSVTLIAADAAGRVLWQAGPEDGRYHLPATAVAAGEPPWTAAAQLSRSLGIAPAEPRLAGVYLHPSQPAITFAFALTSAAASDSALARFTPGAEPPGCLPAHVAQVAGIGQAADAVAVDLLPAG